MLRCTVALLTVVAGCGRLGFDSGRQATSDGGPLDGTGDATTSDFDAALVLGAFGPRTVLPGISGTPDFDDDPEFSGDELELYWNRGGPVGGDIWRATRPTINDPWTVPAVVAELSSAGGDGGPALSSDGLTLYLESNRDGNWDIYQSVRANRESAWQTPIRVAELSSGTCDHSVTIAADDLSMYVGRGCVGGDTDIWLASRTTAVAPWIVQGKVAALDGDNEDLSAYIARDGLSIVFTSDRAVLGDMDLYIATRMSVEDPFGTPTPLTELNTAFRDDDAWLSADNRHIVYTSDGNLYEAKR